MDKFAFLEKHQLHFIRSLIFRFYNFDLERLAELNAEDINFWSLASNSEMKWTDAYIEHVKDNIHWNTFVCNKSMFKFNI